MVFSPIQTSVIKPFGDAYSLIADADATSEWFDCSGWGDMAVGWDFDQSGGTPDYDIVLHFSAQGYYELNNKTATTEDYEVVTIVGAASGTGYTEYDSQDVDELQRTHRSVRVYINNDDAGTACTLTVWLMGKT